MSQAAGMPPSLHVLTLTPFFPSDKNEVSGCFVSEPLEQFPHLGLASTVIAVSPIHYSRKHSISSAPAEWVRYPQMPGIFGLSTAGKLLYLRLLKRIEKLHRIKPIDVIHAHAALPCGHAAALISRRLNIPFVITVHGLDVFNICARDGISATWRRDVSRSVYGSARTVVCISGKVQQFVNAGMPVEPQTVIVPNGVNADFFSPGPAQSENVTPQILVVGSLLPSKGHELVLRALKTLQTSLPLIQCSIIGEGPYQSQFEGLVQELGLARRVRFLGRKSRAEVAEAMRHCSVFVLPSRNEALGCVYLEAMSCGRPAIACTGQGIDEVIEHGKNGWLIPPDGLAELVQGLSALFGSLELRNRLGAAARQTILEKLTLAHQARQLNAAYRQAIAQRSGPSPTI
jgi:glycosyltransferase involved in cell wall biosynthesis